MKCTGVIVILIACIAIQASGCARARPPVTSPAASSSDSDPLPSPSVPMSDPVPESVALTEDEVFARKSLEELNAERPLNDVFFDYDSATLRATDLSALQLNATWLNRWTSTSITIQGHCDSRGTAEYNLALGNSRAAAARNYLVSLGISTDRVSIVSKGKEQPFCWEDSHTCWQDNRRAHFIITAK